MHEVTTVHLIYFYQLKLRFAKGTVFTTTTKDNDIALDHLVCGWVWLLRADVPAATLLPQEDVCCFQNDSLCVESNTPQVPIGRAFWCARLVSWSVWRGCHWCDTLGVCRQEAIVCDWVPICCGESTAVHELCNDLVFKCPSKQVWCRCSFS